MIFKNKKSQKIISAILILVIIVPAVLLSKPKKVEATGIPVVDILGNIWNGIKTAFAYLTSASTTTSATISVKNVAQEVFKQVLMAAARKVLQEITKGTVNWINSGFSGSPLFLENPGSFFQDIAKSEIKNMVNIFGYDSVRYPFGKNFALGVISSYKQTLENNTSYSLSKVMTDPVQLRNYQNNFNVGGWNGFLINTQYPQNNYLGFQMVATEELARRVQGTAQTAVSKVKDVVNQGNGFLSPQTCADNGGNNEYNTVVANAFQRPSFKSTNTFKLPYDPPKNETEEEENNRYEIKYTNEVAAERAEWAKTNTCKNLVNTTPGAVVSSQITNALGSQFRQSELGAAMGNSLSTIFDALLNKFIGQGLNALASKKNPEPTEDTWSYDGQTLGSATEGTDWASGPEIEINLNDFKMQIDGKTVWVENEGESTEKTINEIGDVSKDADGNPIPGRTYHPGDILNTETELKLMSNPPCNSADAENCPETNPSNEANPLYVPGIAQFITMIPAQAQILDQCLPGPDKDWDERLKGEQARVTKVLSADQASEDATKVKGSDASVLELKFAVDSFRDWINTKIISSLPGAIIYMDSIKEIDGMAQQLKELTDDRRTKSQALARLKAIKTSLDLITKQPVSTDRDFKEQENRLIAIRKQYLAIRASISTNTTTENRLSELNTLIDRLINFQKLNTQCTEEREAAGWDPIPNNYDGRGNLALPPKGTELELFCSKPIVSGYSHGDIVRHDTSNEGQEFTFRNPRNPLGDAGYEDLPMVNADNVYGDINAGGFLGLGSNDDRISIRLDCTTIFKAKITDYRNAGDSTF